MTGDIDRRRRQLNDRDRALADLARHKATIERDTGITPAAAATPSSETNDRKRIAEQRRKFYEQRAATGEVEVRTNGGSQ